MLNYISLLQAMEVPSLDGLAISQDPHIADASAMGDEAHPNALPSKCVGRAPPHASPGTYSVQETLVSWHSSLQIAKVSS
jgi:hypothetical protein